MTPSQSLIERVKRHIFNAAMRPVTAEALDPAEIFVPTPTAIYVHIPFCGSFCSYCIFNKNRPGEQMLTYVQALEREIAWYGGQPRLAAAEVSSVFFGGGTPSYLPAEHIERVLDAIAANFSLPADLQITLEANPESITRDKLTRYRRRGVNRISLGVQSFDEQQLRSMGRRHRKADIHRALGTIREAGYQEVSLDLMYGLPEQTLSGFADELQQAIAAPVSHISLFPMIYQPGTPIYRHRQAHRPLRQMYYHALDELAAAGFRQYTTEDFTRGAPCTYQLDLWRPPPKPTLGFGAGSLSTFGGYNWHNIGKLEQYIEVALSGRPPVAGGGRVSTRQLMHDHVAVATKSLRLDRAAFERRFGVSLDSVLGPLIPLARAAGLLREIDDDTLELTRFASFYASRMWSEYILGKLERTAADAGPAVVPIVTPDLHREALRAG